MVGKLFKLTKEGITELDAERETLVKARADVADAIKTAREFGDLSENAEYQAARQQQERNEGRISELEYILANAEVIKVTKGDTKVRIGSTVLLRGATGKEKKFQIVGTVEADPLEGKISDESPIGQALLGKKEGDDVEIKTPAETTTYKIVDIL
jgi:transcription elongation factor GreA